MRHANLLATLCVCVTVIITASLLARAGDLNPPAGAIQPSMHTLDEIYGKVQALPQVFPLCRETWEAGYVKTLSNSLQVTEVASGSGMLHSIVISPITSGFCQAEIIVDGQTLLVCQSDTTPETIVFDTRYSTNIGVKRGQALVAANVTVFYRPDPQP